MKMKHYEVTVFARSALSCTMRIAAETAEAAQEEAMGIAQDDVACQDWVEVEDPLDSEDVYEAIADEVEDEEPHGPPCPQCGGSMLDASLAEDESAWNCEALNCDGYLTIAGAPPPCPRCAGPMHQCRTGDAGCWHCNDEHCTGAVPP